MDSRVTERYGVRRRQVAGWALLVCLLGVCVGQVWVRGLWVGELVGRGGPGEMLATKVNPNVESWASLARLPGIGRARGRAIVRYREEYRRVHGGDAVAFKCAEDLTMVRGIGPGTVACIRGYVVFDDP